MGILLAYFASWGSSLHIDKTSTNSWLVPTTIHIMFAAVIFILSLFNHESPRLLMKRGNTQHALENLSRVRNLPTDHGVIFKEIADIQQQLHEEQEATMGQGAFGLLREMFCMPNNAYRLYLGLGSQLLSQWSGAQSVTVYALGFFALMGTKGQNEKLFATAIFELIKFVASIICAHFLVDVIGRKRSLSFGIALQADSMLYVAAFLTAVPGITSEEGFTFTRGQMMASTGAIVMIYISGIWWSMGKPTVSLIRTRRSNIPFKAGTRCSIYSMPKSIRSASEPCPALWSCASTS